MYISWAQMSGGKVPEYCTGFPMCMSMADRKVQEYSYGALSIYPDPLTGGKVP